MKRGDWTIARTLWYRYYNIIAAIKRARALTLMATVFSAQFVVACPTPVRAADDWLEPRDREDGKRENQNWIIALKRNILLASLLGVSASLRAAERCLCVIWNLSIRRGCLFKTNLHFKLEGRGLSCSYSLMWDQYTKHVINATIKTPFAVLKQQYECVFLMQNQPAKAS